MRCLPKPRYPARIGRFHPVLGGRFLVPFTTLSMAHTTLILLVVPTAFFCALEAPILHAGGFTWITVGVVVFDLLSMVALAATFLTEPGIIPPLAYRIRYLDRFPSLELAPTGYGREQDPGRPRYGYNDSSLRRLAKFVVEGRLDDAQLLVDELGHRASSLYDGHGRTALHYAAHRRHLPMMDLLLRLHFDPRSCDVFGLCPLHYVALDSDEDAFTLLHRALRAAYGLPCPEESGPLREKVSDEDDRGGVRAGAGRRNQMDPADTDGRAPPAVPEDRVRRLACEDTHTASLIARTEARKALSARPQPVTGGSSSAKEGEDEETGQGRMPHRRVGSVSGEVLKHCRTCLVDIEERGHHCADTRACIHQFDHYCPWMGNSIGRRNHRFFVAFLLSATILCLLAAAGGVIVLVLEGQKLSHSGEGSGSGSDQAPNDVVRLISSSAASVAACALLVLLMCMGLPVFVLCGYHTYLVSVNLTTNEEAKGLMHRMGGNPYSVGCLGNLKARLLGSSPSEVAAPWAMVGDGSESDEEIKSLV